MFFWLCQNCWSTTALRFDRHQALAFAPVKSVERDSRLLGLKGQQKCNAPPPLSRGRQVQLA